MIRLLFGFSAVVVVLSSIYLAYFEADEDVTMTVDLAKVGKILLKSVSSGEVSGTLRCDRMSPQTGLKRDQRCVQARPVMCVVIVFKFAILCLVNSGAPNSF